MFSQVVQVFRGSTCDAAKILSYWTELARFERDREETESCERAFSFWEQALFDVFDGVFDKD